MNTKTLIDTAVSLLIGMVGASGVLAADTNNPEQLPNSGTAVDVFVLTCGAGTNNARAQAWDLTNENPDNTAARMLVMVIGPNGVALAATDTNEGGSPSSWTGRVGSGVGPYDVTFEKITAGGGAASGVEYYRGTAYCYGPSPAYTNLGGTLN